jgi:hypothetical protein
MWNLGKLQVFPAGSSSPREPHEADRLPYRDSIRGLYSRHRPEMHILRSMSTRQFDIHQLVAWSRYLVLIGIPGWIETSQT